jgi:hypothetical protein
VLDRIGKGNHGRVTYPLDLEHPVDFHFVLEVKMQVGEQVAKQRVGRQAIG